MREVPRQNLNYEVDNKNGMRQAFRRSVCILNIWEHLDKLTQTLRTHELNVS